MHGVVGSTTPCTFVVDYWGGMVQYMLRIERRQKMLITVGRWQYEPILIPIARFILQWFEQKLKSAKWRKVDVGTLVIDEEVPIPVIINDEAMRNFPPVLRLLNSLSS